MITSIFLSAFTIAGPKVLVIYPNKEMQEDEETELAMKTMPMKGKPGDFITVSVDEFQAVSLLTEAPQFEEDTGDSRNVFASLGALITKETNPVPFQCLFSKLYSICRTNGALTVATLEQIPKKLYVAINSPNTYHFTIQSPDNNPIECSLEQELKTVEQVSLQTAPVSQNPGDNPRYKAILTLEEIMNREKSAFMLDKFILKTIGSVHPNPISLEDIRRKTIPLEKSLGMKIDLESIQEVIDKYVAEGIIKQV